MRQCIRHAVPQGLGFAVLTMSLLACSNSDSDTGAATATSSPRPTTQDTALPTTSPVYEGGIPSVDASIAAVEARDVDALVSQMRYSELACRKTPEPLSIPPFCDGAPEGSLVEAFPTASCEGAYHRPGNAEQSVRSFFNVRSDSTLFGVYRVAGSRVEESFFVHAAPMYAVVFAAQSAAGQEIASGVFLNEQGVVGLSGGCGETPQNYVSFWRLQDSVRGTSGT